MSYPRYPRKHRESALFKAVEFHTYLSKRRGESLPRPPRNVVLVFGARWHAYLKNKFRGRLDPRSGVYRINSTVGIVNIDGPGAPFATIVLEELAALGVRRFLILGLAGSLRPDLGAGSLVVCSKALRDEGTSYHYAKSSAYARPSPGLVTRLTRVLERNHLSYAEGPSWTTDAPYRETVAEIRRYRRAGIVTVEMEAAAVFTVAHYLGRESAALFVISDLLDEGGWEPRFHDTREVLRRALDIAIEAVAT